MLDSDAKHRRSIRLPGYDYASAGAYFVTITAWQRELLFEDERLAAILEEEWKALASRFSGVELDAFVVMPNHVHFILWLKGVGVPLAGTPTPGRVNGDGEEGDYPVQSGDGSYPGRVGAGASPAPTLGNVIGAYKSRVAVRWLTWIKGHQPERSGRVWQRNYYEHIIRNEAELERIRQYILDNPVKWAEDPENPEVAPAENQRSSC